jgi:glycosyltransferase involved in cell wall biosynthesis
MDNARTCTRRGYQPSDGTVGPVKVTLMGTRGVPALYGGFETAVEEIGKRLASRGYDVTVYCRNPGQKLREYEGMTLVNAPAIRHRITETLSHTTISTAHAIAKDHPDVVLLLNAGNAPLLKPLKAARIPTAIHLDGLESKREKWRGAGAKYYRWAEQAAVRWGQEVIADAQAIADYVKATYGRECVVIPYGADVIDPGSDLLGALGVESRGYHLVVARFEPENHVLEAVQAYRQSHDARQLLVVGSAPYSQEYVDSVKAAAKADPRIRFLGGVYDQALLDQLYANCRTYIHGHSVGGTNPSLLRAMGAGAPVLGYDVEFNREVTDGQAFFWSDAPSLTARFDAVADGSHDHDLEQFREAGRKRITAVYQWDAVTDQYEVLIQRLAASRKR